MPNPILEIKDLEVGYKASKILQKVNLTITSGLVTVIGRNGMGKTTLVKAIMNLATVTQGEIKFGEKDITRLAPYKIAQLGIGYVPQSRHIFSHLSVDEQLRFVYRNTAQRKDEWNVERVYDLFPRLKERYANMGTMLSGGEQQMLAIGRALTTNPSLLLMDEPSEGLAPVILDRLAEFIDEILKSGISLLLVEQNLPFVKQVTDEVHVLMPGNFGYHGSLQELLDDEELTQKLLVAGV